jgi:hypothetical protein
MIRRHLLFALFLIFYGHSEVMGELYQYRAADGSVVITDDVNKVPDDFRERSRVKESDRQKETPKMPAPETERIAPARNRDACGVQIDENLRICREYLEHGVPRTSNAVDPMMYQVALSELCGKALLREHLTVHEREQVRELAAKAREIEKSMNAKDRYEARAMSNYFFSPCTRGEERIYTREELDELGEKLKKTWKKMAAALARNDIERAVDCYLPPVQDTWRQQFKAFPADKLKQMGQDLLDSPIFVERVEGNSRAVCHLLSNRNGKEYSFQLIFVSGLDGEWQIYSY